MVASSETPVIHVKDLRKTYVVNERAAGMMAAAKSLFVRKKKAVDELTELLDLSPLLGKPVRNLSLGERMKCEIAVALLHQPKVLFLDEPTIGLDITMQRRIRTFIGEYNRRRGATVLLTSHY